MKKAIVLYILLSVFASALNYTAYPLLGRILPPSQYIDITVALSILTQITTFLSSIIAITIGLTKEEHTNTSQTLGLLQSILFRIFAVLIVIFLSLSPIIFSTIHTPAIFAIPIAMMMFISLPMTIISGYLNGKQLMVKLGIFTVISAGLQLLVGSITAFITKDGFIAMISMSIAQFCAITLTYWLFRSAQLPNPLHLFSIKKHNLASDKFVQKIIFYTIAASIAIMLINLTQIVDLLIITANKGVDSKFYTDLYVFSRVMFFAGMIFIWPFLSVVSLTKRQKNRKPFAKIIAIFLLIALGMSGALFFLGSQIINLLLGVWYNQTAIFTTGCLAVLFKLSLLIITAVTLYFMIFRNYTAIVYAFFFCLILAIYATLRHVSSTNLTLIELNIIATTWSAVGIYLFLRHTQLQKNDS